MKNIKIAFLFSIIIVFWCMVVWAISIQSTCPFCQEQGDCIGSVKIRQVAIDKYPITGNYDRVYVFLCPNGHTWLDLPTEQK